MAWVVDWGTPRATTGLGSQGHLWEVVKLVLQDVRGLLFSVLSLCLAGWVFDTFPLFSG